MSELQEKRKYYLDRSLKAVYFIDENGQKQGTYTEYERNTSKVLRKIEYKDGKVWNGKVDTGKGYIVYRNGENAEIEKYSHVATFDEIKENEYNLNIPRYVDTFEEEEIIDIDVVNTEIADLKVKIAEVEKQMAKYLEELGLN